MYKYAPYIHINKKKKINKFKKKKKINVKI